MEKLNIIERIENAQVQLASFASLADFFDLAVTNIDIKEGCEYDKKYRQQVLPSVIRLIQQQAENMENDIGGLLEELIGRLS